MQNRDRTTVKPTGGRRSAVLGALLAIAGLPSCVAVVAGSAAAAADGYIYYEDNEAYQDFDIALEDAWDETIAAMQRLNYPVSNSTPLGPTEGEIDVGDVRVRVEAHSGFSRVRVRVGTFRTEDHERRARLILEAIEGRLH